MMAENDDSEFVPPPEEIKEILRNSKVIVDEAIEKGVKVVWMQEGVINEEAGIKYTENRFRK